MSHLLMDHGLIDLTSDEEVLGPGARKETCLFLQSGQALRLFLQTWGPLNASMKSCETRLALLKGFELGFTISEVFRSLFIF